MLSSAANLTCSSCTDSACWASTDDLQFCTVSNGDRWISSSPATVIAAPQLTYASGYLRINNNDLLTILNMTSLESVYGYLSVYSNPALPSVSFPSLRSVGGYFSIVTSPALTYASLPKLTFLGDRIYFCANHADFVIPASPPTAPLGGLVVTGPSKGAQSCILEQGTKLCGASVVCP
jgi:hypothetical protein